MSVALRSPYQRPPYRGYRLGAALALSLGAHLGLFALVQDNPSTMATTQTLHLSVQTPRVSGSLPTATSGGAAQAAPAQTGKTTNNQTTTTSPRTQQVTEAAPAPQNAANRDDDQSEQGPGIPPAKAGNAELNRAAVQSDIRAALQAHFSYPALARRHGWEGEVVLKLALDANGRLFDVRVAQSSGHRILDRAAMDALKALAAEAPLANGQNGQPLDNLHIPVIYRLQG